MTNADIDYLLHVLSEEGDSQGFQRLMTSDALKDCGRLWEAALLRSMSRWTVLICRYCRRPCVCLIDYDSDGEDQTTFPPEKCGTGKYPIVYHEED